MKDKVLCDTDITSALAKTDLKNFIIAKNRNIPLLTNDSKLYYKCAENDVKVYDLRQILKTIFVENLLPDEDLKNIVTKIEDKDNTKIKDKVDLFNGE